MIAFIFLTMDVQKNAPPKDAQAVFPHLVLKNMAPGYKFQTKDYPYSQIIHVQTGRLFLREGAAIRVLRPGWTIILFPHTVFQLFCRAIGYTGIGIVYASGPEPHWIDEKYPAIIPPEQRLSDLFKTIWQEVQQGNRNDLAISAARFMEVAVYNRAIPLLQKDMPSLDKWLEHTREMLRGSTHEKVSLRERLAAIPVSYAHLSRSFRAKNRVTLKRFLLQEKIKQAQNMLLAGQMRITDIAFELGFSSSQHFATCFRGIINATPSAWRQRQRSAEGRQAGAGIHPGTFRPPHPPA